MVPWQVLRFKADVVPLLHILRYIISPVVILVYICTWCKVSWVYRPIAHMTWSRHLWERGPPLHQPLMMTKYLKRGLLQRQTMQESCSCKRWKQQTCFGTRAKKRWSDHEGSWEIQAASHVWPINKQMAPPRIAGALSSYTPYTRKSKQWVEITWWKRRTLRNCFKKTNKKQLNPRCNILRRQNFEPFNFIMWQYSGGLWV